MSFECKSCGTDILGCNCAYILSWEKQWKNVKGCEPYCKCGYPVRAEEVRKFIFRNLIDNNKKPSVPAYIFCENDDGPHVYYGTYVKCYKGNGITANDMSAPIFERYENTIFDYSDSD